jgi:predicted double-glycine peptidase
MNERVTGRSNPTAAQALAEQQRKAAAEQARKAAEQAAKPVAAKPVTLASDTDTVAPTKTTSRMSLAGAGAPSGPAPRDARDFDSYIQDQGDTNGCGTTSLAALLSFWKGKPEAYTRTQIDEQIRYGPDAMAFTSPDNIEKYAKDQGFRSNAINDGSLDQLKGYLDKGVPVQVLYDPNNDGGDTLLHYVNVTGYNADADGNVSSVKIADPATGESETLDREEFEERWGGLEMKGVGTGLNNVMLVTLPGENTPIRGRDGQTTMSDDIDLPEGGMGFSGAIADLVSDTVNSLNPVQDIKNTWNRFFG